MIKDYYILEHIKELCKQRGWSYYRLAQESNIPYSSLNTMLKKQHIPSIHNLKKICKGFDITMSNFFMSMEKPTKEQEELLNLYNSFDRHTKDLVMAYMCGLSKQPIYTKHHIT